MKRMKKHKIKTEKPEASASHPREFEEHDLAYYIHDRVELMHQVFSILKYKEIKAIVPQSVRDLAVGDLQELCTEELLGISSKRLVAILDGAEPPSDTESSSQSPDRMETISLDSISSDEEILSQSSKKKKHKHSKSKSRRRRDKQKAKDTAEAKPSDTAEVSKASRAGLTVLELLELQARARAIRAQLQSEQHSKKQSEEAVEEPSSDDEDAVEIKEETPDVVEISSGDEKPDVRALEAQVQNTAKNKEQQVLSKAKEVLKQKETTKTKDASKKKEKAKNSKQKETNLNKSSKSKQKESSMPKESENEKEIETKETSQLKSTVVRTVSDNPAETEGETCQLKSKVTKRVSDLIITVPQTSSRKIKLNRNKVTVTVPNEPINVTESRIITIEKPDETKAIKKKKLKKNKKKSLEKEGSDHDEITLQLSDSEKMFLLEDWNKKGYEKLSSSADSESSSSDTDVDTSNENISNAVNEEPETGATVNEKIAELISVTDNDEESKIERTVDNKTEIAQPEIEEITESIKQSDSELTETTDKQLNKVETSNDEADNESNTNDKVQSPVIDKSELNKENDNDESVDVDDKIVDKNADDEIQVRAEKSSVNISTEIDNVTISDTTKNSQETDKIIKELQKDTVVAGKQIEALEQIGTENIVTFVNKEKTNDLTETVQDTESAQNKTDKENTESMKEMSLIDDVQSRQVCAEQNQEIDANMDIASESNKEKAKDISEGELSDRASSEVEAFDMELEVVCISDEDTQKSKKKKKKEKKAKKDKKAKKSKKDFRERADQNFYKDADKLTNIEVTPIDITDKQLHTNTEAIDIDKQTNIDSKAIDITDDNVYEILELSDDSSCYEVEGTVLSKEPTAEEIAALSATIDDINEDGNESKDEEVIYDHSQSEKDTKHNDSDESEKDTVMSWKERYLGSNKVKKVLTTANILNALRNKNKQLKTKMEESRKIKDDEINKATECQVNEEITKSNVADESQNTEKEEDKIEEGSIEQYQTLPTLPKYVVTENIEAEVTETEIETDVTKELKRDAKQLFKMYKKLMYSKKAKRSEKKRLRKVRKRIERDNEY